VWLGNNAYKINLLDVNGVQQANFPMDNISSISTNISAGLAASTTISQGQGLVGFNSILSYPLGTLPGDLSDTTNIINGDALIGVLQPFTGAVARTQHSKNADILSVKDFGAVGDGVTDDTNAFAKAYATSLWNEIPPGTYKVSTLPNYNQAGTRIIGKGQVVINYTGSGQGLICDAGSTTQQAMNIYIDNLTINGTAVATDGIFIRSIHHSIFRNIRIRNFPVAGLRVQFAVCDTFDNWVISNHSGELPTGTIPTQYGMYLDHRVSDNGGTDRCTFINPVVEDSTTVGIFLTNNSNQNNFIGGTVETCLAGVHIDSTCEGNTFTNTDCEANGLIGAVNTITGVSVTGTAAGSQITSGNISGGAVTLAVGMTLAPLAISGSAPNLQPGVYISSISGSAGSWTIGLTNAFTATAVNALPPAQWMLTNRSQGSYDFLIEGANNFLINVNAENPAGGIIIRTVTAIGNQVIGGTCSSIATVSGAINTVVTGLAYGIYTFGYSAPTYVPGAFFNEGANTYRAATFNYLLGVRDNDQSEALYLHGYSQTTGVPTLILDAKVAPYAGFGADDASSNYYRFGAVSTPSSGVGVLAPSWASPSATLGLHLNSTTPSNSRVTGALVVDGGVGIGGALYTASGTVTGSDMRLKKDIEPITDALAKVQMLSGFTHTWNKLADHPFPEKRRAGLSAQDLLVVLPESVATEGDYLGVDYCEVIPLLVNAIKELASCLPKE
jgi:hypothetical protein